MVRGPTPMTSKAPHTTPIEGAALVGRAPDLKQCGVVTREHAWRTVPLHWLHPVVVRRRRPRQSVRAVSSIAERFGGDQISRILSPNNPKPCWRLQGRMSALRVKDAGVGGSAPPDGLGPAYENLSIYRELYIGRSLRVLGVAPTASSPAEAMSLAPVRFRMSFARVISSDVSQ